jgi:hypothetical protein
MKRIISVVLLSLFASLFQGVPTANATAPGVLGSFGMTQTTTVCTYTFSIAAYSGNPVTDYYYKIVNFHASNHTVAPSNESFQLFTGEKTIGANSGTNVAVPGSVKITWVELREAGITVNMYGRLWIRAYNGVTGALHTWMGIGCAVNDPADTSAPTLSSISASSVGNSSATLNFTSNETGTYYYLVYPATQTAPTSSTVLAQGTASAKGTSSATASAMTASVTGLIAGTAYKAHIVVKDATGNTSTVSTVDINTTVATPSTPDLSTSSDLGTSSTDNSTSDNTPTFSVSGTLSGTGVLRATKAGSTDVTCTLVSGSCTLGTLADGTWGVTITDTAGNGLSATSSALSIVIDTSAPTAAFTASHPASITSSDTATVTSSEVGTIYLVNNQITVNNLASITGAADSSWNSASITSAASSTNLDATGLVPGTYVLYAVDGAGNLSAISEQNVIVTLTAPAAPTLDASSDTGSLNNDKITNDDTPTINIGGLTVGASVTLTATGTALTCTFIATGTTGSCTFPSLPNGTYAISATQTFNDITSSASTALTGIVINKSTITTPSTPDLTTGSDLGSSSTDDVTSVNTPTISVSGTFTGTAILTASKAGSTSINCDVSTGSCTLATLADGVWSLTVTDTDSAGNATTSAALSITIDATKPLATVATLSQTNGNGATVPVQSNELGTAYLVESGTSYTDPALVVTAAGSYNVTISAINTDTSIATTGLTAGTYKVYVIDAAGNLSLASTNTVTIAAASAPLAVLTTAPSGSSAVNSVLTSTSTFSGVPTPSLTYQWVACTNDTDPATCTNISGATSSTFTPTTSVLVGTYIRLLTTATNSEGSATSTSSPTVAVVAVAPSAPTLGTVVNGDLQITVPFTAPASDGGSAITKYQYSLDGTNWLERTDSATVTSPIIIKFTDIAGTTPLVAGTAYTIQIRGVNAVSGGTAATTSAITAVTAPGAPTGVTASATGQTTATVSFTAPSSTGGSSITSYTVTSSPGGITATGSSSPISITGLTASTAYTFTVTASNAAATSVASTASTSITTSAPPAPAPVGPSAPAPEPEPICGAACVAAQNAAAKAAADKVIADRVAAQNAAAKAAADKVIADRVAAEAKVVAEKIASDTAAKVVADKVVVDKSAAEAAAKAAVDKAAAAAVTKAASDAAAAQAAVVAKAAADAQAAAVEAASKAAAALKSATTTAAAKATATATAARAATTATNAVKAAATAAKAAATAKNTASNASKQVDIAIGALGSQTASASSAAQANAIAAAAKAAANAAAKSAADQAVAAKVASNNANKEATDAVARIAVEQKAAADAAAAAKAAADADLQANELKIATATESQKAMEAVVAALNEKVDLAEASVKAATIAERAEIDKKIADVSTKIAELQKVADEVQIKADAAVAAQVSTRAVAEAATQNAVVKANEVAAIRLESIAKTDAATKAAADASLAAKVAKAAKAAAAKVPSRAVIAAKPSNSSKKNSATATISGLKPGQKVKVTVNVKGK